MIMLAKKVLLLNLRKMIKLKTTQDLKMINSHHLKTKGKQRILAKNSNLVTPCWIRDI